MKKGLSLASLAATLLLMASTAFAQVPPPPGVPGANESPGTGQADPAPLPAPKGWNTTCRHPDSRVGNYPTEEWYNAMHGDIYYMQQHVKQLKDWAKDYHQNLYRYASWFDYVLDEYY